MLQAQIDTCNGQPDGTICSYPGITDGACRGNLCMPGGCGNGIVEESAEEKCDDGNRVSFDGCSADCRSLEQCGDGVVDLGRGELCDCGLDANAVPTGCNGPNSDVPSATCRPKCVPARCGDKIRDLSEQCDDGNNLPGDGCRADCNGRWTVMASGVFANLNAVWGTGSDNVFAVGNDVILHYDGTAWSAMATPDPAVNFTDVWASGNVAFATSYGRLDRFDGTSWAMFRDYDNQALAVVSGRSPSDFWVAGGSSVAFVHHYVGTGWEADGTNSCNAPGLSTLWVEPVSGKAYATSVMPVKTCAYDNAPVWSVLSIVLRRVWGTSASDLYAIGPSPSVLSRSSDGINWVPVPSANINSAAHTIGGVPGDLILIGGPGRVMTSTNGTTWTVSPTPVMDQLQDVWSYAPGRAFIVGANGTILY